MDEEIDGMVSSPSTSRQSMRIEQEIQTSNVLSIMSILQYSRRIRIFDQVPSRGSLWLHQLGGAQSRVERESKANGNETPEASIHTCTLSFHSFLVPTVFVHWRCV